MNLQLTKRGQTPFLPFTAERNAFTIIELLISMTLLAMLMTAVAFAFDASIKNYQANQGIYRTVNTARAALLRITSEVRTAGGFEASGTYYPAVALTGLGALDDPADNSELSITTAAVALEYTYRYDSDDNTLYLIDNKTGDQYELCDNVTAMSFVRDTCTVNVNGVDYTDIRSVRIVMTVTDDEDNPKITQTLAAASVVRKNL